MSLIRSLEFICEIDVSLKAQEVADLKGLGDLRKYNWKDQVKKSKMNDLGRKVFHWEHYYTVQQIINELIKLKNLKEENIYNIIKKVKICWILKEENKALDKIAKSNRPDPKLAYNLAGIKLIGAK